MLTQALISLIIIILTILTCNR